LTTTTDLTLVMEMTMTVTSVDVVDQLAAATTDVLREARAKYAEDLDAYRRGVTTMADTGGTLPPDEAERLLAACRALGIPAGRLAEDATVMLRHRRLTAEMDARLERNARHHEAVMVLKAKHDAESAEFVKVRTECDTRMKAAEAKLNEAHRAYAQADSVRSERVDQQQEDMRRLWNASPYLFEHVDPEALRRIVTPA
jgi:hypothetical protein